MGLKADRELLVAALAATEALEAALGEISPETHQPGLYVDNAIVRLIQTAESLREAIKEDDEELLHLDELDAGEEVAYGRARDIAAGMLTHAGAAM
jgi:hypothetical protein